MGGWKSDELERMAAARELELATVRRDGTLRRPVTIWVVRHGDDLYVRSWRGRTSTWFRHVQDRPEAHISAGGVDTDVLLVQSDDDVHDAIDAAYESKYRRSRYVKEMIGPGARATTLKLVPREDRPG